MSGDILLTSNMSVCNLCVCLRVRVSFRTHMQNIKDITSSIHYEMYRVRRLNESNTVAHANGIPQHHLAAHEM